MEPNQAENQEQTPEKEAPRNRRPPVPPWYYMAFHLRMLGLTYEKIAEKVGHHEDHVRKLFAKGGALETMWKEYRDETARANAEEAMTIILGHLPNIARAMVAEAQTLGMSATVNRKMAFELARLSENASPASPETVKDIMELLHDAPEKADQGDAPQVAAGPDAALPEVVAEVHPLGQAD